MDTGLEPLIRLQEADTEIAQLAASIAALPKHLAAVEEKLRAQRLTVEQAEKALLAEEVLRRRMESDLKDQQQKIAKFREQTNSVKNNDQYRALQHEISFAEAEIRRVEDRELESMERSEALTVQRIAAQTVLAEQALNVEREKESARIQTSEQQARMDALSAHRAELRAQIDETMLATYDRVASSARKTGLARVQGQRCLGCQMALRPQMWNQVRSGTLTTCESCGRLLYYDPALEPAPPGPAEAPKRRKKDPPVATDL